MKMKMKKLFVPLALLLSPFVNAQTQHELLNQDITLICFDECEQPELTIRQYLAQRTLFAHQYQKITVLFNGESVLETTIYDYLAAQEVVPKPLGTGLNNVMDGALTCEADRDFTCEEWQEKRELAELSKYLNDMEISYQVTQAAIDLKNTSIDFTVALLLAIPSVKFAGLFTKFTNEYIAGLLTAGGLFPVGKQISDLIKSGGLKAGDTVTLKAGELISVSRSGSSASSSGNSSEGGTSGNANSGAGAGSGGSGKICRTVYTGSASNLVAQQVCWVN